MSFLYLKEILAGYSNLGCKFFSFITLTMSCHSFLAWRVYFERSAVTLMGIPLCVICCFSLAAFNICSLLIWLIYVLLHLALGLSCLGLSGFLGLRWLFPSPFWGNFQLLSPVVSSHSLSFCFLLLGLLWFKCWGISHCARGPWGCPHFFNSFFLFSSLLHLFPAIYLLPHLSYLLPLLFYCWFPPECGT